MNDATTRSHPHYGTCGGCHHLKHVDADGLVRDHNRYRATGTVVSPLRCTGSRKRYLESTVTNNFATDNFATDELSA